MTYEVPTLPRTVRPRLPVTVGVTPIIVVTETILYVERSQDYHDVSDLFAILRTEPPSIIVAEGMARLLLSLHTHFGSDPRWQFCVTPMERERWKANRERTLVRTHDTLVSWFGWKGRQLADGPRGGKRHEKNRYHIGLDPVSFAGKGAAELSGNSGPDCDALLQWATGVREFCITNGLKIKPTTGGLAGQLLRDPRFYPKARRKVPAVINAKARDQLPGNHYRLYVEEGESLEAYYLDQAAAHHHCAQSLQFPCANRLYSWGRYRTTGDGIGIPRNAQDKILGFHGLFRLAVTIPDSSPAIFPPPWAEESGDQCIWIYSNELPMVEALGIHVRYVIEAHVSPHLDTGLNKYAEWCLTEIAAKPAPWVKPTLLAGYGILAAKPRIHKVGFAHSPHGTPRRYPAGGGHLPVMERATTRPSEPPYANVIHRGMIEAETRQRSLALARDLHSRGYHIIACYADSVFVGIRDTEGNNVPLPLLPAGWKVESELTNLVFLNPVSFVSAEMSKTPGVPSRRMSIEQSGRSREARASVRGIR